MAAPPDEERLESRINRATNPLNKEADWDSIQSLCEQLNKEPEGPQLVTRLLAHKIQSPQEWEAMQALMVLETCMKKCEKRFHNEVGKFRFLNELIKVVSPKYLGTRAPEPVKKKVLEVMFSWTVQLPDEPKIADAYQMLKKQGIVKQDPVLPDDSPLPPPPPKTKSAIFEDEEKSKMLSRLLNSTHPEDLRAANKLIKEMVQEDQKRMEKVSKRVNAIQEVKESRAISAVWFCLQDLYRRCEKMRPTLFRLASDTEDNDEALADILQANDSLTQVINLYRQMVKGEEVNGDTLPGRVLTLTRISNQLGRHRDRCVAEPHLCLPHRDKLQPHSRPTLRDLQTKSGSAPPGSTTPSPVLALPSEQPGSLLDTPPGLKPPGAPTENDASLANVTVPLDSIKPSSWLPVTVFDKHSLRVLFHFARDSPPCRPDVLVVIISMLSSAPIPVTDIRFQSAVPKVMRVKLQPPSGTELPAFNPILPPAAITQVLLLANPHKEKVRLKYKLTFKLGEESHDESGDVEQFPPPENWGSL
uniref:Golgi-associated, gamma adaptin ear containing, ARF binding protein 1 n=1 Tax=Esox lucius TaxID=8010 RepID=A0A6Q2XDZ2_ESOLU